MILANINIGTGPSAGDGDPLRTAFNTINNNFANIESNVNALSNSVSSVAGRQGNVILTTQDIVGINNYATISYVNSQLANAGAANILSLQSNVASLQADVNTLYGNAGIQSSTLATLTSNAATQAGSLATLTSNAASQAGELSTLLANAVTQTGEIVSLLANAGSQHEAISSLQSNVSTLFANAGAQAGSITTLTSNAAVQAGLIADTNTAISTANTAMKGYVDGQVSTLTSNAAVQAGLIADTNTAISTANTAMKGYVDGQVSTLTSNAAVQAGLIADIKNGVATFGNLIPSANVTYSLGSPTNWWKDLFLSGNTIHIGGATLSVSGGAIQSSLPIAANLTATNITVQGTRIEFASGGYIEEAEVLDGNASPLGYYGIALNSSDDGLISMNALDSNAVATSSVIVSNVSVQLNVANSTPGGNPLVWNFDQAGNITFPDGTTQNTAAGAGGTTANLVNDTETVSLGSDGILTVPGTIKTGLNQDFYVRASDDESDGWSIYNVVDDGAGNILAQTRLEFDQYTVRTDAQGAAYTWAFRDTGVLELPGDIYGNVGGNLTIKIGDQAGSNTFIDLQTRSYVGDALISNIRIGNPNVTISTNSGAYSWSFGQDAILTVPYEGVIQSLNDTVILQSKDTTSGNVYGVRLGTDGGLYFSTTTYTSWLNISNSTGNANLTASMGPTGGTGYNLNLEAGASDSATWNSNPGGNVNIQGGYGSFGDGGGGPGGDVNIRGGSSSDSHAGNVNISSGANEWSFENTGNLTLPSDGYLVVTSGIHTSGASLAPVISGFSITNSQGISGSGNVTAGNISASGISGKIGYSSGNFAQQTTSNSTQVTSHFTSGNIQLMSIDLAAHDVHTVAFACNKLTTNDMLIVKHIAGGLTSVYVDAYVASNGLAVIWMRDITGVGTGSFSPMLKYTIIRAPSA